MATIGPMLPAKRGAARLRPEDIVARLGDYEDAFVERKVSLDTEELRQVVVAFANSLGAEDTGFVFYGVANDGTLHGIEDPDGCQRSIRKHLQRCYPSVLSVVQTQVATIDSKAIIAVLVSASADRPHFTGGAWIRKGSETVNATTELFQRLVEDRLSIVRHLRGFIGKDVSVLLGFGALDGIGGKGPRGFNRPAAQYMLADVNAFYVTLLGQGGQGAQTYALGRIQLEFDTQRQCPRLRIKE